LGERFAQILADTDDLQNAKGAFPCEVWATAMVILKELNCFESLKVVWDRYRDR
jgi:hypothetical protein